MIKSSFYFSVFGLLATILFAGLSFLIYISIIPNSVIPLPLKLKFSIVSIFPQGWSFFTRNPTENHLAIYRRCENGEKKNQIIKHVHSNSYYGLSRYARRLNFEYSNLIKILPPELYKPVGENDLTEFNEVQLDNHELPIVKNIATGTFLAVIYEPIPWSWSSLDRSKFSEKSKGIVVNFTDCYDNAE